jgi:hypothetical protein
MTGAPPFAARPAPSAPRRRSPTATALGVVLAAVFFVAPAAAQAPQGPPPPPPPQGAAAPAPLRRPPSGPAPVAATPAPARTAGVVQPSASALQPPPGRARSAPPDSSRLPVAAAVGQPAGAVARCRDGSFIIAPADPSACATHRGVGVLFPQRAPPPRPGATPQPVARVVAQPSAPPAGATMRCKDGTWLSGAPAAGRCDANGGTAVILPSPRPAPPTPLPHRP